MKTALMLIATGPKYWGYASRMIGFAKKYFVPHDVIVFTDARFVGNGVKHVVDYFHQGYPEATYRRYHAFHGAREILSQYNQLFYSDVDMELVARIEEDEIFSDGITATEHPGFVGSRGDHEQSFKSTAYCPNGKQYFCGGFNGGDSATFLAMSKAIVENIDIDDRNGVQANWVDEAHFNKYLHDNPPAKILTPSFCYPEDTERYLEIWAKAGRGPFEPKLVALDKGKR
jgi:glycosyl transferase family 6